MKITFDRASNSWFSKENNVFFHMPFLKGASDKYLIRLFKTEFNINISPEEIDQLRSPKSNKQQINLGESNESS
jgi:hypothetical protein